MSILLGIGGLAAFFVVCVKLFSIVAAASAILSFLGVQAALVIGAIGAIFAWVTERSNEGQKEQSSDKGNLDC